MISDLSQSAHPTQTDTITPSPPHRLPEPSLAVGQLTRMEFSTDTRLQVYCNFRSVAEQEKREGRTLGKKRIRKLIKERESLQALRKRIGHQNLVALLLNMVEEGIFDSELRAWQEFPEVFPARPANDGAIDLQEEAVAGSDKEGEKDEGRKERGGDGSVTGDDLPDDEIGETMTPQLLLSRHVGAERGATDAKNAAVQHGTISGSLIKLSERPILLTPIAS